MRGGLWWIAVLCAIAAGTLDTCNVYAESILAIAAIGVPSHQHCILRIGQALAARGHNSTLLVSDSATDMSREQLGSKAFPGLEVLTFKGPPGVGTSQWYEQMNRHVNEVCYGRIHCIAPPSTEGLHVHSAPFALACRNPVRNSRSDSELCRGQRN